jgi:hypothetical protein
MGRLQANNTLSNKPCFLNQNEQTGSTHTLDSTLTSLYRTHKTNE